MWRHGRTALALAAALALAGAGGARAFAYCVSGASTSATSNPWRVQSPLRNNNKNASTPEGRGGRSPGLKRPLPPA